MNKNIEKFCNILKKLPNVGKIDLETGTSSFISITNEQDVNKNFIMVNIIPDLFPTVLKKFNIGFTDKIFRSSSTIGEILAVNEYQNYREALLKIPLKLLTNTSYRSYLEQFPDRFKMNPSCLIYLGVHSNHPLYNYVDAGNHFFSKFKLEETGRLLSKVGNAGTAYQYISVFDRQINPLTYSDQYFLSYYRRKVREFSRLFSESDSEYNEVRYRDCDIRQTFSNNAVLFEVDYLTEVDFNNVPKTELLQLSKVKETTDLSKNLLTSLPSLEEDDFIELPSKLQIKKDRVVYAGQELYSSIITPEDFLFNTKKTFPGFPVDTYTESIIYKPVLTLGPAEELNWDRYFEQFILYNWIKCIQHPFIKLKIGSVDIELKYDTNNLFYINGKRINKMEVVEVLGKAVCANTIEDYNEIVNIVSKTSLEMHKFINTGLTIELNLYNLPDYLKYGKFMQGMKTTQFDVSFRIARIKNINYIELLDKIDPKTGQPELIRIKDTRALMDLSKSPSVTWSRVQQIFGEGTKVLEKSIDLQLDADDLLKKARDRYITAFKKSEELLNSSIKELGAKRMDFQGSKGVWIKGISGNEYFIKVDNIDDPLKGDPNCTVAHYPSNEHICIVDKSGSRANQIGLDKVVARMYALKNDSLVAQHIHTLQSYVSKN